MATFADGEGGLSVRTKINAVLQHADGTSGELVINDAGADVDFRVEGVGNTNLFRVDAGGVVSVGGLPTGFGTFDIKTGTNKHIVTAVNAVYGGNVFVGSNDAGAEVPFGIAGSILHFSTTAQERMRITASGVMLIGTTTASGANLLQVTGDALVNGFTVGRGGGNVSGNLAVGLGALAATNSGVFGVTGIGEGALGANTTGASNTAVGSGALLLNTTGGTNTAIGANALRNNSTASNNTAVGVGALQVNTTGTTNTAVGYAALNANTTAGGSTAFGSQALVSSTGSSNTAIGQNALFGNTTGTTNIALGQNAGLNLTTGSNNTIIGSIAGTAGLANTVIIGAGTTERLRIDSVGALGVGVTPSAWDRPAYQSTQNLALLGLANTSNLAQNAYFNGGWRYMTTAAAAAAQVGLGSFNWFIAPSGTAGDPITFTQAMTLDASGRLLVGTTSGSQVGRAVIKASESAIIENGGSVAAGGTLDITVSTNANAYWQGILTVINADNANGENRTQSTISCMGNNQFGSFATSTIQSINGSLSGRTFTVTYVATGIIRITNTSATTNAIRVAFFGNGVNFT